MKQKHYILVIVLLVILNVFSWRFWWVNPLENQNDTESVEPKKERFKGDRREKGFHFLMKRLDLTKDQRSEFKKVRSAHFLQMKQKEQELDSLREELKKYVLNGDSTNQRMILYQNIAQEKYKMEVSMFEHFDSLRNLCSEQQKMTFDTILCNIVDRAGASCKHPVKQKKEPSEIKQ